MSKVAYVKRYTGFLTMTMVCLTILYAPLIIVAIYSFNSSPSIIVWEGLSLHWYWDVFFGIESGKFKTAAWNSLSIAVMASLTSTTIATAAAIGILRGRAFRGRNLSFMLISMPIMVPEIVTAVATLIFFSAIGFVLGYSSILVAHIVFCIPFAYLPIAARLRGIEPVFEEAALDLYASRGQLFRHVIFPMLLPGILAGLLLAFIVSLDDFIITNFVKGAGIETLPTAIFGAVKQGIKPNIMALSTIMLLVSIVCVTLSYLLSRVGSHGGRE